MSDMSDQAAVAGDLPDGGDAGCQKRLHGENGAAADGPAGAAEQPPDCEEEQCEFGEPEPPQKRVKVDPDSELDIRFLICSKVSACRPPARTGLTMTTSQEAGAIIGKGGANINHLRKDVSIAAHSDRLSRPVSGNESLFSHTPCPARILPARPV